MEILEVIQQRKEEIQSRFGVERIGLVKSPRGSVQKAAGRINLLVEFGEVTIDVFLELKSFLEELFGRAVDLASFEEPAPPIRPLTEREISWWD